MIDTVHAYVAAFDRGDPAAVTALFAADATVEDPVGTEPKRGRQAILDFYTQSMATGAKLALQGPVRAVVPYAAFAFQVALHHEGSDLTVDVIDIFRFDADGKIAAMTAYFGPSNMREA
ncbi:MAG: nuclear transport factor 2 family protein [Candidatus Sphingomonas colombiensis]|nr:nuclear transport factor 2 family protein [Sphingomonas sp.]WEK42015.1 MAG: nuclear transport factor 2 family protein [Sphingomonas sp.]